MKVWLILTQKEFDELQEKGVVADTDNDNPDLTDFPNAYEWLKEKMALKGKKTDNAVIPLFGWTQWEAGREKPDLRWMRWNWYPKGEHVLVYADVPDEEVVQIDATAWYIILNNNFISDNEPEYDKYDELYGSIPFEEKKDLLYRNWEKAFDVAYVKDDDWRTKGSEVYAVFWTLRKENILESTPFTSVKTKEDIQHETQNIM